MSTTHRTRNIPTASERNVAAEARAVEDGHRSILVTPDLGGPFIKVVSDTNHGKWFRVGAEATTDGVVFTCQPHGPRGCRDHGRKVGDAGIVPCKHAALAARRLEREGLAHLDASGRWVSPLVAATEPATDDVFAGWGAP